MQDKDQELHAASVNATHIVRRGGGPVSGEAIGACIG